MKTILRNAITGETVPVTSAKGRLGKKIIDVWVDMAGNPVCAIGAESPNWTSAYVAQDRAPEYPIGLLGR